MGLEEMVKRIEEEAKLESERMMVKASDESRKIRERSQKELQEELRDLRARCEKEKRTIWNMYISDGKRKARHSILCAKEDVIWDALGSIRTRLREMDIGELIRRLPPLILEVQRSLGPGARIFAVRAIDARALNGKAPLAGVLESGGPEVALVQRFKGKDLIGGFIAVSARGDRILDMSFSGMLDRNEERVRELVSRAIFGE